MYTTTPIQYLQSMVSLEKFRRRDAEQKLYEANKEIKALKERLEKRESGIEYAI